MLKTSSLLEAVALIGLGIIIESPEKRKLVIDTLDKAGMAIENSIKNFIPKGSADNVSISAKPEISEIE